RHLGEEITFVRGGRIQTRAARLLDDVCNMLQEIEKISLETAMEKGLFADIKRFREGGKGGTGVIVKHEQYYNPFIDLFMNHSVSKEGRLS
ncbi:MAG: D-lysine 5,6-aminomutase subunit alpha, partial [Clostridia bacterium]|nr:D-lysine 5,6-aminomutase subunit alpha [Clostridia bacterium]